jgi:hypothetical protein
VTLGVEGLAGGGITAGRGWAVIRAPFALAGRSGALTIRAGGTTGDSVPQFQFRAGGPHTVRGYAYGTRTGAAVWAGQLDIALSRRSVFAPVLFIDVGDRFNSGLDPLVAVGGGFSILEGIVRLNWSKGLTPGVPVRFDLLFRAPR